MKKMEELIKANKATIIDVRTPGEFMGGHVSGSINIPLNELPEKINELREMDNIVLCCASGNRSERACAFLEQHNINCADGGSWMNILLLQTTN